MPESRPQVALMAAGGQYALPYRMAARDDGTLEFSWRPEHTFYTVPADPEIRVTATPGADEAGPAWIIRSHLPVAGDDTDKARWCNERNADLLLAAEPPMELMVFGGWGLTAEGECCLTIGQSRRLVRDDEREAARNLGYLLREEQSAVVAALRAAPEAVREVPLTAAELAAGLDTVRAAFGRLFGEQPELAWATEPDESTVLVTCGETIMEVPVGYGRPQLALVYGELLASFPNGRSWLSLYALFPEPTVDLAFEKLQREGLLWVDEDGRWVFDAGHTRGRLADHQGAAKAAVRRGAGAAGGRHPRRSRHRRVPDDHPARAVRLGHPARGRGRARVGHAARHRPGPGGCPAAGTAPQAGAGGAAPAVRQRPVRRGRAARQAPGTARRRAGVDDRRPRLAGDRLEFRARDDRVRGGGGRGRHP